MSRLPKVKPTQAIQRFLEPLAQLARSLADEDGPPSLDLLVEENVVQQVKNLLESDIIKQVRRAGVRRVRGVADTCRTGRGGGPRA